MLLVNASKGASTIHGVGLVAREPIPAGTRIWTFQPGFDIALTPPQLLALSPIARVHTLHYSAYNSFRRLYVLSSDDDRFTNHSEKPNTVAPGDEDPSSCRYTVALWDIQPGEELTWDYRSPWRQMNLGYPSGRPMPHEEGPGSGRP